MTESLGYTGPAEALVGYYADRRPRSGMYRWRTACRLCGGPLATVLRLADTPPANELVDPEMLTHPGDVAYGDGNGLWRKCTGCGKKSSYDSYPETPCSASSYKQDKFPLVLARCDSCEHFQLQTVVDPSRMFGTYHYVSGTSPVFRAHLEGLAEELASHLLPGDLVVEIGSNDGTLLRALDGTGVRVLGVDPAKNLADEATASGILTYPGFFDVKTAKAIEKSAGKAKIIVALNVLAHADGLAEIADACRSLLADDGELVLEVAYLPDMLRDGTFDMIYAEHVAFWHLKPMARFFSEHGIHIYDAEHVDSQGGSIRCFFSRMSERAPASPQTLRLVEMLQAEKELAGAGAIAAFCQKIDDAKVALGAMLRDLKAQGKKIAAFGCPAKATTLLHHFDIGRETIDYIVEENPLKVGKFSPGKHVPIVGVDAFKSDPPDVCVVLAWNFAENIMARHDWFQGDWVVPLPTTRIERRVT